MNQQAQDLLTVQGFRILDIIYNSITFEASNEFEYVLVSNEDGTYCLYNADPEGEESDPNPLAEGTLAVIATKLKEL